jgi:hypothetical protein
MFEVLGPMTSPGSVLTQSEPEVRDGLDLPCKNVDLQTKARWASSRGRAGWTQDSSGYLPLAMVSDVAMTEALQNSIAPGTSSGPGLARTGGWFFSVPRAPQPPPDVDSRRMMKGPSSPTGVIINLNPCCFGEVYWVGGTVGKTYMAFATWIPYAQWAADDLPIIVHFRPYYNDSSYSEAATLAQKQGVPAVLGQDSQKRQSFLDGAWYYLLGMMGFVQQMLAARKVAVIVVPVPPVPSAIAASDQDSSTIFPKSFPQQLSSTVVAVVAQANAKAAQTRAGGVTPSADRFIFTANSQGGAYLMGAAKAMKSGLREIWMFDCNTMEDAWAIRGVSRRLYVAQPRSHQILLRSAQQASAGSGSPWEYEGNDWSVVDVSKIPSRGVSMHDFCGRVCFSHAAKVSLILPPLRDPSQRLDMTLSGSGISCWDRLEFWKQRSP